MSYIVVDSIHVKRHVFLTKKQVSNWAKYDVLEFTDHGYIIIKHGKKIQGVKF